MKLLKNFKAKEGKLYNTYKNLLELNDRLDAHHTFMLASGIAFNLIIYMIPLFLLVIYIIKVVFDLDVFIDTIEKLLIDYLPPTVNNADFVHTIIEEVGLITEHAALFGWIGVIGLLWISSFLISSIRISLNTIFHAETNRFFLIYFLKDIFLTIAISILILLYSYAIPLVNFLIDFVDSMSLPILDGVLSHVILTSASILTSFILFIFIYKVVPNTKLPRKVVLIATTISVVAIELARYIFAWYLGSFSNYGKFYGTYAVIISMSIWIYYSALIILLSAEISKFIYDKSLTKSK
ncbi:MAG: YihY/virulence factor BrkB family protein [Candidatus Kapabacteria bacterium]|nr:YihY/virulence factor BrkB family protein [Ignavibacteriota bacterium]MCW5885002.1 YihY/virulence factor BrkB family protein [Candidatus Kapabacteria bacterium]